MIDSIGLMVLDMAGTTVSDNQDVARAFQKSFEMNGIYITQESVQPLMGYHKPQAIRMALTAAGRNAEQRLIDEIYLDFQEEMLDFYRYDPAVKPMDGAEDLFQWLKEEGIRVGLNTGFSHNIAAAIVHRFQWLERGLVDYFVGSDEVEKGRPHPYMIQELMKRSGIDDPLQVGKVGDTSVDVEEGKMAGCRYVIAVSTGAFSEEDLETTNPTHLISHLSQVPAIIMQHGI